MAGISFKSLGCQNWVITPVHDPKPPTSISDQRWLVVLTGVGVLDLPGNNANDWRREVLVIYPDIDAPLQFAVNHYSIPKPSAVNVAPAQALDMYAPYAAVSSTFSKETGVVDAGFSMDDWRPNPFRRSGTPSGIRPARSSLVGTRQRSGNRHRVLGLARD